VLLVVSPTAANAIVQLFLLLPHHHEQTHIMSSLEAISLHELVARDNGRDVRLGPRGRRQSGYTFLLGSFGVFSIRTPTPTRPRQDEDSDMAEETDAGRALSDQADIVLEMMAALDHNVSLIRLLHGQVHARLDAALSAMDEVNPVNPPGEESELLAVPTVDAVNHGDCDPDNNTI
jgi:hypothetical protein